MTWQAAEAAFWEIVEEGSWSDAAACAQVTWQAAEAAFREIVEEDSWSQGRRARR